MITRTPPPTSGASVARKRGLPLLASSSTTTTPTSFASFVAESAGVAARGEEGVTSRSCTTGVTAGQYIANPSFAATVSPFVDRAALPPAMGGDDDDGIARPLLEPMPEEELACDGNFDPLPRSTNASCRDFFDDDYAYESASEVDDLSPVGYFQEKNGGGDDMVGTTVACRMGCGSSSWAQASARGYCYSGGEFSMLLDDDCPPPTKRPRMDDGTHHHRSFQPYDEEMSEYPLLSPPDFGVETDEGSPWHLAANGGTMVADSANTRTDIGEHDGMATSTCHVCSLEAHRGGDCGVAAAISQNSFVGSETPRPPRRNNSLFAYFQPTKRPASHSHNHRVQQMPNCPPYSFQDIKSSSNPMKRSMGLLSPCRYCDKPTCASCTRRCEMCQHTFCIFCTKVNYDSSVQERVFCFECDARCGDIKRDNADCDMMDMM